MSAPPAADADTPSGAAWRDAILAAQLFAIDPTGLGGIAVRGGPSPARDMWAGMLRGLQAPGMPQRRMPSGIADDRLLGGIDLAATLKAGKPVIQTGILIEANGGTLVIPMAERMSAGVAARIAATLDRGEVLIERDGLTRRIATAIGVVAFDEGATPEEQLPAMLAERLAFHIDLNGIGHRGLTRPDRDAAAIAGARARLGDVAPAADEILEALVHAASAFGIASVVAPLLALRTARAAAALAGRSQVTADDAALAARLVLAPRALALPDDSSQESPPAPQDADTSEPQDGGDRDENSQSPPTMEDLVSAAVQAALPPGLLERLGQGRIDRKPPSRRDGKGASQASPLRGRPIGARQGAMGGGARLALIDTLRAAAPWQPVRRAQKRSAGTATLIDVRREDFRIRKFAQRREASIVFCVDASGSAAFHRLAEAKGAVELLLGEAYVARTYAALIAFRGKGAELLLPPSRSLTRAKALLAMLPGGGGTPLAAGIDMAFLTALSEKAKGRQSLIVFLTDGQANIARDGQAARPRAFDEALQAASQLAAHRQAGVFVDTAPRAREEGARLAAAMGARYIALPRVEAGAMRDVVRAAAAL